MSRGISRAGMAEPRDTWANLPVVTAPLLAITGQFAAARETPTDGHAAMPQGARAALWTRWGAARGGARMTLTRWQAAGALLGTAGALAALALALHAMLLALLGLATFTYFAAGLYKMWLLVRGERALRRQVAAPPPGVPDDALPLYSVLVPLHREGKMLGALVERLEALDYPPDRLEILLLVETDDAETHTAIAQTPLPPHIRPLTVPAGRPRTKPRALNVGLAHARGEFIVVYDAEDRPDSDQLRKAVAAFRALPRRVVCVQARLNFYNMRQSLLARLFAVDYVQWYYTLLPGLARPRAFVPLGGTSNHFRIRVLRRLGGWDPYNVTEDCDLGTRIGRAGLDVAMLDSTTWEEAVTRVRPWVRQRSRWVKGYLQTYLVHMRHPIRLWRQLGPRGFGDFQLLVGGSSLMLLANPAMWLLTVVYAAAHGSALAVAIHALFPPAIYYPSLFCFVVGNFLFFYIGLYVCYRHGFYELAGYALLAPVYWVLMSVGAWTGLLSLLRRPHYWAKTDHGVSLRALEALAPSRDAAPEPALSVVVVAARAGQRLPERLERLHAELEREQGVQQGGRQAAGEHAPYEVIVVDDGSRAATGALVEDLMADWPELRLAPGAPHGAGGAIREGIFAARGALIVCADGDAELPVAAFSQLAAEAAGACDIAVARRAVATRMDGPRLRRVARGGRALLGRVAQPRELAEAPQGALVLRRAVAVELCRWQTVAGRGFALEWLAIARLHGYVVRDVPVSWPEQRRVSRLLAARDGVRRAWVALAVRANRRHGVYDDALPLPDDTLLRRELASLAAR